MKARMPSNDTFTNGTPVNRTEIRCMTSGGEEHIKLYDRIALEEHIDVTTRADRIQNSKHWILTLNAKGPKQSLNQRPDFAQAKREFTRLHDEHLTRTQQQYRDILRSQQIRQRKGHQSEGNEEYDYVVDPNTRWRFYKESR